MYALLAAYLLAVDVPPACSDQKARDEVSLAILNPIALEMMAADLDPSNHLDLDLVQVYETSSQGAVRNCAATTAFAVNGVTIGADLEVSYQIIQSEDQGTVYKLKDGDRIEINLLLSAMASSAVIRKPKPMPIIPPKQEPPPAGHD